MFEDSGREREEMLSKNAEDMQRVDELLLLGTQFVEAAPALQRIKRDLVWQRGVLETIPASSDTFLKSDVKPRILSQTDFIQRAIPQVPRIDAMTISSGGTVVVNTSNVALFEGLKQAASGSPNAQKWAKPHMDEYVANETDDRTIDTVAILLQRIDPKVGAEFSEAVRVYKLVTSGMSTQESIGIHIRNVIQHLPGKLWLKAKTPKEQTPGRKKLDWDKIANRLVKQSHVGTEQTIFAQQGRKLNDLYARWSNIAHQNERADMDELKAMFAESVAVLYALVVLIYPLGSGMESPPRSRRLEENSSQD